MIIGNNMSLCIIFNNTYYDQWANDIKYFNSAVDFQNYVNKVKQKLHVAKIHYVTSFPVGNLHGEK